MLLGVHSQDEPPDAAHVRAVAAILVPDNYSDVELGADLALLRLAAPARLGPAVRPVCLPRASHRFAHGTACWATGWGSVQEAGERAGWRAGPRGRVRDAGPPGWVDRAPRKWVGRGGPAGGRAAGRGCKAQVSSPSFFYATGIFWAPPGWCPALC